MLAEHMERKLLRRTDWAVSRRAKRVTAVLPGVGAQAVGRAIQRQEERLGQRPSMAHCNSIALPQKEVRRNS